MKISSTKNSKISNLLIYKLIEIWKIRESLFMIRVSAPSEVNFSESENRLSKIISITTKLIHMKVSSSNMNPEKNILNHLSKYFP